MHVFSKFCSFWFKIILISYWEKFSIEKFGLSKVLSKAIGNGIQDGGKQFTPKSYDLNFRTYRKIEVCTSLSSAKNKNRPTFSAKALQVRKWNKPLKNGLLISGLNHNSPYVTIRIICTQVIFLQTFCFVLPKNVQIFTGLLFCALRCTK